MHLVESTRICGRPREQKHRDVQIVGADSLWRFRMRIYVLVRDVNNARDAAINPQRGPPSSFSLSISLSPLLCKYISYLGLGNCRLLRSIAKVTYCYYVATIFHKDAHPSSNA